MRLLRELGYGVALLTGYTSDYYLGDYRLEEHALVGIKCDTPNVGEYCTIETTSPGWAIGEKPPGSFSISARFDGKTFSLTQLRKKSIYTIK